MTVTRFLRSVASTGALAGFLWLAAGVNVNAASIEQLRFSTEFSFMVNGKMMPPGTYVVRRVGTDPKLFEISNRMQKGALISVQNVKHRPDTHPFDAGVIFEGTDGRYVLRTLWDDATGAVESITAAAEIRDVQERRPLETLMVPADNSGTGH